MIRTNPNIVGYLQKKNFFSRSPSPSPSPQHNSRFNNYNSNRQYQTRISITPTKQATNRFDNYSTEIPKMKKLQDSLIQQKAVPKQNKYQTFQINTNQRQQKIKDSDNYKPKAFQSSRVEMKMCMEELLRKIAVQLRLLQGAIMQLTTSQQTLFYKKLNSLKNQIFESIETIFTQARNNLSILLNRKGQSKLKKLLKSKQNLTEADVKMKKLKGQMQKNWKKVAAQILSEQLDQKIQRDLKQSNIARENYEQKNKRQIYQKQQKDWQNLQHIVNTLIKRRCS